MTFDPARISDIYSRSVAQQVFDGLVEFDHTLSITPALAESWKASRDGLTWTFSLRKGVKFHHGREVAADDVVYSFTRILDPAVKSGAADLFMGIKGAREFKEGKARRVSGLAALDSHTVQVTLNEALAPFVSVLAVGHAKIVPKELVEQRGEAFGSHPIGTARSSLFGGSGDERLSWLPTPTTSAALPSSLVWCIRSSPGSSSTKCTRSFRRETLRTLRSRLKTIAGS